MADEKPRYQSGAYASESRCEELPPSYANARRASAADPSFALAVMAGYIAKLVSHAGLWFIMWWSNKKRDRAGPADSKLAAIAGMEDKTEKENPNFRYVL